MRTVRELIYWEYAKLVSDSMLGSRREYAFVNHTFKKLMDGRIHPSSILRENQQLFAEGEVCAYCGASGRLQWEHVIPISRGGPDTLDNMVRACAPCNQEKGARDPYQWYMDTRPGKDIPRLALGKLLKLCFDAYASAGLLDSEVFMTSRAIERRTLSSIFNVS